MKRVVAMLAVVMTLVGIASIGYAKPCPLPPVNTDAEIKFLGLDWYTDYEDTLANLKSKGYKEDYDWARDDIPDMAAHWNHPFTSIAYSEKNTGGWFKFWNSSYDNYPKVAGYDLHTLNICLMWNPETGYTENYMAKGALQFYYAEYWLTVTDKDYAYKDIAKKLKTMYGDNPYVGDKYGDQYLVWVNKEKAAIILYKGSVFIELVYMAPGSEERLAIVEENERIRENENAAGDYTGL